MKRWGVTIVALTALALAQPVAEAQEKEKKQEQEPATAWAAPKPAPEMEKLAKMMVGTWSSAEKHEPSPFSPAGGTGKGVFKVTLGPGGHSLVEQYNSRGSLGKFNGHGMTYWDPKDKVYRSVWCDNFTPTCDVSVGHWEGDNLVFLGESEMEGQKTKLKMTYSGFKAGSFEFGIDMSVGDAPMARGMTIKYTRAKARAAASAAASAP
ncbi:MAG TPA: DUF1579 family protein [Terriglobales bacterium]|nr:DUF1579 family protein [Terriglobales bacterium]